MIAFGNPFELRFYPKMCTFGPQLAHNWRVILKIKTKKILKLLIRLCIILYETIIILNYCQILGIFYKIKWF